MATSTVDNLHASLVVKKGWYKHHLTMAENAYQELDAHLEKGISVTHALDRFDKVNVTLNAYYEKLAEAYEELELADPQRATQYATELAQLTTDHNTFQNDAEKALDVAISYPQITGKPLLDAPTNPTTPAATAQLQSKANDALKPFILTREHTPRHLRVWLKNMAIWFESSNFERDTLVIQQAYFTSRLGPHLKLALEEEITDMTIIFGNAPSCSTVLETEFECLYPVFDRRYQFFQSAQAHKQPFTDWCTQLRQEGDEARLDELDVDGIYAFRFIVGCRDKTLQHEFFREKVATLAQVLRVAHD